MRRILFATDFSSQSAVAAPVALSLAQENQARLLLVHVVRPRDHDRDDRLYELSVAEAIHQLYETVPEDVQLWCHPGSLGRARKSWNLIVPGERIVEVAEERSAATHFERDTAHNVVAHACPILTVRSLLARRASDIQELRES